MRIHANVAKRLGNDYNFILSASAIAAIFMLAFLNRDNILKTDESMSLSSVQLKHPTTKNKNEIPEVLPDDLIYNHNSRSVFVIPEYKLIFFTFPKVACSEWKRMFMRINGNENWCKIKNFNAHDPDLNKIQTLDNFPTEIATAMLTSPKWTRAAIVREPKERVLSAFLDKAVKETYYAKRCCARIPDKEDMEKCKENETDFKSFLTFVTKYPKECFDVHWEPQVAKIDEKWWPYIDFIGYQNSLTKDAKTLLMSLKSTKDPVNGRTAWDRYGKSGWGEDPDLCEKRKNSFLEVNTSNHKLDTGNELLNYYTSETEKMVEEHWAIEWEQEKIQFPKVNLFPTD